jgi:hypothetical protein
VCDYPSPPQDELEKKYVSLVQAYGNDLKTVQEIFLQARDSPPIASNLPPIAGRWAPLTTHAPLPPRIRPAWAYTQNNNVFMPMSMPSC